MSGDSTTPAAGRAPRPDADQQLANLLAQLGEATSEAGLTTDATGSAAEQAAADAACENQLIQVRLGIASGLFTSLRCKHAPTASHSLRVALGCSSWAMARKMTEQELDEIELAALMHDIGKIGVPDNVLLKPGRLSPTEATVMDRHRRMGVEILRGCCATQPVLDIVYFAPAWYDGKRSNFPLSGEDLPMGARMVAIVDAFDSMTTDHVHRRAMSRERALAELFQFAGSQFDSALVKQFARLHDGEFAVLGRRVARRWLELLDAEASHTHWHLYEGPPRPLEGAPHSLFHQKLLDNMRDGVVFVDGNMQIQLWNRGAERLTGLPGTSVYQRTWIPSLVGMCDEKGRLIPEVDCPVHFVLRSGVQSIRRLLVTNRSGRQVSCDVHIVPVIGLDGATHGANLLLHDASPEATLEERCQSLHEKATRDPLTQVANRAEFDRAHKAFVQTHLERGLPCSLIICDIDHFKRVNDTFGHQAGDEAIITFAQLLKQMCRPGDLVARYGGEEFVLLCADCDNTAAAQRAEQIRRSLVDLPLKMLAGNHITASFGVTEVQPGDTDETMLRRADRALLMAKDGGRNAVVQLGSGIGGQAEAPVNKGWLFWWRNRVKPDQVMEATMVTPVPLKVAIEKLRGFVADHFAYVDGIEGSRILLRVEAAGVPLLRRASDWPVSFLMELCFSEEKIQVEVGGGARTADNVRTRVRVVVRPKRQRDRRHRETIKRARQLLASLRSYLIAAEVDHAADDAAVNHQADLSQSWLGEK